MNKDNGGYTDRVEDMFNYEEDTDKEGIYGEEDIDDGDTYWEEDNYDTYRDKSKMILPKIIPVHWKWDMIRDTIQYKRMIGRMDKLINLMEKGYRVILVVVIILLIIQLGKVLNRKTIWINYNDRGVVRDITRDLDGKIKLKLLYTNDEDLNTIEFTGDNVEMINGPIESSRLIEIEYSKSETNDIKIKSIECDNDTLLPEEYDIGDKKVINKIQMVGEIEEIKEDGDIVFKPYGYYIMPGEIEKKAEDIIIRLGDGCKKIRIERGTEDVVLIDRLYIGDGVIIYGDSLDGIVEVNQVELRIPSKDRMRAEGIEEQDYSMVKDTLKHLALRDKTYTKDEEDYLYANIYDSFIDEFGENELHTASILFEPKIEYARVVSYKKPLDVGYKNIGLEALVELDNGSSYFITNSKIYNPTQLDRQLSVGTDIRIASLKHVKGDRVGKGLNFALSIREVDMEKGISDK